MGEMHGPADEGRQPDIAGNQDGLGCGWYAGQPEPGGEFTLGGGAPRASAGALPVLAFAAAEERPVAGMVVVTATNAAATTSAVAGVRTRARQPRRAPLRIGSSTR